MRRSLASWLLLLSPLSSFGADPDAFRFDVRTIAGEFDRPMGMDLAPDGRVFLIELAGSLWEIEPQTGARREVATLPVFAKQENGLLGIALDPNFTETQWIYLLYSPVDFVGQSISRFQFADGRLDLASEDVILRWATQRDECCHHGGMLQFGPDGLLYASAGDNTHPFGDSQSYAPIDRRRGREPWNAEKSSGNPNDLRGGILRIRPLADGTYAIPDGNLFPPGTPGTRPERYIMGCRNPWKFSIDPVTGYLYWGDVGPDAGGDGPRGPRGYDEINQARQAGNHGWPYFIADNQAYAFVDFAMGTVGEKYDPDKPINNSPLNTGRQELPPAQGAFLYWPYGASEKWPELGQGGRTACAGPVFRFQETFTETRGFPKFYDNCLLVWDWHRPFLKWARLDENANWVRFEEFVLPDIEVKRPSDALFAPDGSLYLLDYGSSWGANKDSKLLQLSYRRGNLPPVAKIEASSRHGALPLTINLNGTGSADPEGKPLTYRWTVQPNDKPFSTEAQTSVTFDQPGDFTIRLEVSDPLGETGQTTLVVIAGNTPPTVGIAQPLEGSFYEPGEPIAFELDIVDAEDGDSKTNAVPFGATVVTLTPRQKESVGLAAMRSSDCFNCHHVSQKLVGPSFTEISSRYRELPAAFDQSVQRVLSGSSNVWGPVPMLPHTQLTEDQVRSMVRWIYDLDAGAATQVARGVSGKIPTPTQAMTVELSANFNDASQGGTSSLVGSKTIRLHPRQVEAEWHDANNGTERQTVSKDSSDQVLGSIHDSHWAEYHRFRLAGAKSVTFRLAPGVSGGQLRLHVGETTLAKLDIDSAGETEAWSELAVPLEQVPEGMVDLRLSFSNRGKQNLFKLDWFRFED